MSKRAGAVDLVRLLLEDERVDPCDDGFVAMKWACGWGQAATVSLLMQEVGMSHRVSAYETLALCAAAKRGRSDTIQVLLASGCVSQSAIHHALKLAQEKGFHDVAAVLAGHLEFRSSDETKLTFVH